MSRLGKEKKEKKTIIFLRVSSFPLRTYGIGSGEVGGGYSGGVAAAELAAELAASPGIALRASRSAPSPWLRPRTK